MANRILIIDDDDLVCKTLQRVLVKLGYETSFCLFGEKALDMVKETDPDLILLDIYISNINGLEILKELQNHHANIPVIMITGYSDVNIAVKAMKLGAYDFLLKPVDIEQLKLIIHKTFSNIQLQAEVDKLHQLSKNNDLLTKDFFGRSSKIRKILAAVEKLAKSQDTTILIGGESGTGKEMIAKYIHQNSPRANGPFIQINCSAIPKELAESELFGHEKGAFTGAQQKTKLGKFELAAGGTILLDEIGELSSDLQVKLLRVLQEKKFYRVGGEKEINVDVRVLAATNKNLEEEVRKGNFREDLFYRLNVGNINIPPLRERTEDIPLLAYSFLNEFSQKFDKHIKRIEPAALELLQNYPWKGNIRELRNIMERVTLLLEEDELKEKHFQFLASPTVQFVKQKDEFILKIPSKGIKIDLVLRKLIEDTLHITNGNQVKAAEILGLSRSKLRYRMEQLGIEVTRKISQNSH